MHTKPEPKSIKNPTEPIDEHLMIKLLIKMLVGCLLNLQYKKRKILIVSLENKNIQQKHKIQGNKLYTMLMIKEI